MTAQLSREDVKELRNSFQCWQQDYDPKDDAEQYEMFGRAITATDMLLAGMDSEPVAVDEIAEQAGVDPAIADAYMQGYHDSEARKTAPVAVPDEMYWQDAPVEGSTRAAAYATGWNACRAAMLKAGTVTAATVPELTNAQCLEFLSVAFRHATIKGDIEFDDIRLGLKMALSAAPEQEV